MSSCSNRVVVYTWNYLLYWIVSANTTDWKKFWRNRGKFLLGPIYNFRAQLRGTKSRSELLCEES